MQKTRFICFRELFQGKEMFSLGCAECVLMVASMAVALMSFSIVKSPMVSIVFVFLRIDMIQ